MLNFQQYVLLLLPEILFGLEKADLQLLLTDNVDMRISRRAEHLLRPRQHAADRRAATRPNAAPHEATARVHSHPAHRP